MVKEEVEVDTNEVIILIIPLLNELLSHRIWNKTRK